MGDALILLGPPGAGKGTQSHLLAEKKGWPHISTGDILRDAVNRGTPEGREAQAAMARGELVSDEIVARMVEARLAHPDCKEGFILDGFPRTLEQWNMLEGILRRTGHGIRCAVQMNVPEADIIERLAGRRVCSQCSMNYHVRFRPPAKEGVCDSCGGALIQRKDDMPQTVRDRIRVYERQTQPLTAVFREKGILCEVDGTGETAAVASRVAACAV